MVSKQARSNMVSNQLRPNRIEDPLVLEAMGQIPREHFLPRGLHGVAYADEDIRLPNGSFLIEPLAAAKLLQAASILPGDLVMVIGCDTGYVATVASRIAATVITIQPDEAGSERIQSLLDEQEADNVAVSVKEAPIDGDADQAPVDAILVIGALPSVPAPLVNQLGDDGRLVMVLDRGRIGKGVLVNRIHGIPGERELFDIQIPTFTGLKAVPAFSF